METKDITYIKMMAYTISILRFDNIEKIRNNEAKFNKYTKQYIINWTMKRLNTNHKDGWNDFNISKEDVIYKAKKLDEWIMKEYKTKEYMKNYNNEYYHNVRKFKDGRRGIQNVIIKNRETAQAKTAKNTKMVKFAIKMCEHMNEKPTLVNLMKYSKLGKTTVVKYKKILMPKKPKV